MKAVVAYMVDSDGNGMALCPATIHKLECLGVACTFPECACPPKERSVKLRSPIEPRIQKKDEKR